MVSQYSGEIAAFATAICWTITALAFESAAKRIGSLSLNLIRLIMAIGVIAIYTKITRGLFWPSDASAHTWLWLGASGFVGFTIGDLFLFRAYLVIGARLSLLLYSSVPIMTTLFGWLILDEILSFNQLAGVLLTVIGVGWTVSERTTDSDGVTSSIPISGIFLGLGAAAGQAMGLVMSKYGMGEYDAFAANHIRCMTGAIGFAVIFFVIGWWPRVRMAFFDRKAMVQTSVGAVFGPFLGVSLSLVAVQFIETGIASTIMALMPILIIPPAIFIFKERVSVRALFGTGVAVSGTILLFL